MLAILVQHKLFAKFPKYEFGVSQISYLGHIISVTDVAASPNKLQAIVSYTYISTSMFLGPHRLLSPLY